jgi:hypothetical protein
MSPLRSSSPRRNPTWYRAPAALAAAVVLGCASSSPDPATTAQAPPPETQRTVSAGAYGMTLYTEPGVGARAVAIPLDRSWELLEEAYKRLDIPVEFSERSRWEKGNPGYRARRVDGKRMSTYLDCGNSLTGPKADTYDVTMMVLTKLDRMSADSTLVTTTIDANARPRATSGSAVHCASKGVLELRVAVYLQMVNLGH